MYPYSCKVVCFRTFSSTCSSATSWTSGMGLAVGSVLGLAVYSAGTSVNRNSQSACTSVATCTMS